MLGYDLAEIYGYEVKRLNEQVKRNIARFPEDFMFQLTKGEIPEDFFKSQIATLNENGNKRGLHIKKLPYAFTEQGIYMLGRPLTQDEMKRFEVLIYILIKKPYTKWGFLYIMKKVKYKGNQLREVYINVICLLSKMFNLPEGQKVAG